MNIFYTNSDPFLCAQDHCTIHTRKMIVEYAQMLSTAHRVLDDDAYADRYGLYKKTHVNHPSAKWVRESYYNYTWLFEVYSNLCDIYKQSTGKVHKSSEISNWLACSPDNISMEQPFTEPPKCMPDECKTESVIDSYKKYINTKYVDWQNRDRPMNVEWYGDKPLWA